METIRVLVVDDHPSVREMVRVVLATDPAIRIVGEASNGREALDRIASVRPDVVIMDIVMPELNGLDALHRIREQHWDTRVLMLTTSEDRHDLLASMEAGALGYVLKRTMARDLVTAVRAIMNGSTYVSSGLVSELSHGSV